MHLQENTLFDLDLGVKVTQNVTQYPLHHVIYAPTKFEVATSKGLGEDTITRNVTDGRTDRRTDGPLLLCLCLTSHQQLRSYGDGATA